MVELMPFITYEKCYAVCATLIQIDFNWRVIFSVQLCNCIVFALFFAQILAYIILMSSQRVCDKVWLPATNKALKCDFRRQNSKHYEGITPPCHTFSRTLLS